MFQETVQEASNLFYAKYLSLRKTITFEIAKKNKKTKTMYKNLEYAPNYNPQHELVKR